MRAELKAEITKPFYRKYCQNNINPGQDDTRANLTTQVQVQYRQ